MACFAFIDVTIKKSPAGTTQSSANSAEVREQLCRFMTLFTKVSRFLRQPVCDFYRKCCVVYH